MLSYPSGFEDIPTSSRARTKASSATFAALGALRPCLNGGLRQNHKWRRRLDCDVDTAQELRPERGRYGRSSVRAHAPNRDATTRRQRRRHGLCWNLELSRRAHSCLAAEAWSSTAEKNQLL